MRNYVISFTKSGKNYNVNERSLSDAVFYVKTLKSVSSISKIGIKTYSDKYKTWIYITEKNGYVNMSFKLKK